MVGRHNHPGGFSRASKVVCVESNIVNSLLLLRCRLDSYDVFKDLPKDDVAFAQKIAYKVVEDEVVSHNSSSSYVHVLLSMIPML